ncbi:MAG: TIGR01777 family oxidoreductase [Bacteroidota bacterium]
MKIIIAGGTGFFGTALVKELLQRKHNVTLLSRDPLHVSSELTSSANALLSVELWDGGTNGSWRKNVDGADAVINLAGESIAGKRWSPKQKTKIINSRVNATKAIVESILKAKTKPQVLINSSAVGYYGSVESGDVTEEKASGNDFLSGACRRWEQEARRVESFGVRLVILRTGIVLGKNGGALKKMELPFKLFVGGPIGNGRQWMPWIHIEDVVRCMIFALEQKTVSGPINMTAPNPVTMKQFSNELGKAMHRPSLFPVPGFILKIIFGEMAEMLLTGQKAIPSKLSANGFVFKYPSLPDALSSIYH